MTEIAICRVFPTDMVDDIDREVTTEPCELLRLVLGTPPPGASCSTVDFLPDLLQFGGLRKGERTSGILQLPCPDSGPMQWTADVQLTPDHHGGTVWVHNG